MPSHWFTVTATDELTTDNRRRQRGTPA